MVTITQIPGIGMQGFADDLIGEVEAIEIGRIDVVHAGCDGLAENGDGADRVFGGPQTPGPANCIAP